MTKASGSPETIGIDKVDDPIAVRIGTFAGAIAWVVITWALLTFVPALESWANGDRLLIIAEVAWISGAVGLILYLDVRPKLASVAAVRTGELSLSTELSYVVTAVNSGILFVAAIGALVLSDRFRAWTYAWPPLFKGIGLFYLVASGGLFLSVIAIGWFYTRLMEGLDAKNASLRLQSLLASALAFGYGGGLYYGLATVQLAAGQDHPILP